MRKISNLYFWLLLTGILFTWWGLTAFVFFPTNVTMIFSGKVMVCIAFVLLIVGHFVEKYKKV